MRKWCLIIMMIQLLSLFCSACFNDIMIDTVPQNFDINSGNNILHGGYVAKQGDSLLYSVIDDGIFNRSGLYVSHNNKEKRIIKGNISSINIQGDDIYYIKQEKIKKESIMEFNLYKYSISNREEYQIIKNCDTAIPAGNKIYYTVRFDDIGYKKENKQTPTGYEENGFVKVLYLETMKIDIIIDKETEKYTISGDKLYYQQQNQIIALDLNDKSEKIIISENKILDFQIAGDNIYYLTYDYKTAVSEVKLQSLSQVDKKTLFSKNDQLFQISVSESTVYFSDNKNNCYKINNNEMSETLVTDDCLAMFVFNNKLYLWNNNVNKV